MTRAAVCLALSRNRILTACVKKHKEMAYDEFARVIGKCQYH
jgi:hypothetical protein